MYYSDFYLNKRSTIVISDSFLCDHNNYVRPILDFKMQIREKTQWIQINTQNYRFSK